jgi:hypothetical protein
LGLTLNSSLTDADIAEMLVAALSEETRAWVAHLVETTRMNLLLVLSHQRLPFLHLS